MEPPLPRPPDGDRRRKRRELDARRSKCRIRLGGHLEQWCRLKEQLGFALHSQLAKFLLDRYSSQGCVVSRAPRPADPNLLHADADALQRLVALSHGHSRECGFIPDVKPPAPGSLAPLVWECVAGHRFSWGVPSAGDAPQRCDGAGGGSERGSPPVPVRRRSLRRTGVVVEPMVEEPSAVKDDAVWSPGGGGDGGGDGAPQGQMEAETAAQDHESTPGLEEKADGHAVPQEEEEEEDEDFAEEDDLTYTDDLRDENYHPSQDSDSEPQRRQSQPHTRKKPVKEEQTPNEQNPIDSSSAEEKGGQVRCPDAAGTRGRLSKQSLPVEVNAQMAFTSGCNHPSFTLPWRTLLPYLVALHLLQPGSAQSTVVAPSLRVTANVGQDVVLCCHLSPCKDVRNSDIRWIQQRSSRLVHHYRNGVDLGQMEEYKGRTELLRDGLSDGNLDLRITAVTSSDSGSYSCAVQDGDAYAEAVVNLEVSDPFSMIILYWTVALAVIITLLVGSFVVNVFLHRKKVAQSRELKRKDAELVEKAAALERKDAELAEQAALSKQRDAMLEKHVLKLEEKTDEVENWNSVLKKDSEEMGYGFAELKKLAAELEKHSEEMGTRDLKLERLAAKLEHQTKELEKQHSQFQRHFQNMYLSAGKQKKMVTKLEEHCEQMVRRNVKLEAAAVKVGHKAKESEKQKSELKERHEEMGQQAKESEKQKSELKERHEEMAEQTEAVEKPSEDLD